MEKTEQQQPGTEAADKLEKSKTLAAQIILINSVCSDIDLPHLREMCAEFETQARQYDTMAVINPGWRVTKGDLIKQQAKTMRALLEYVEANHEVTKLRQADTEAANAAEAIQKFFL